MLFFDPSTHEYFHSVDAFFKHISASGQGLEEMLAMVEEWCKASVSLYLHDAKESFRRRELGSEPLRKRCSDALSLVADVIIMHDVLIRWILERHGSDPELWFQCREAKEATSMLQ